MQKISKNIEETREIAEDFFSKLKPIKNQATIVCLFGDLGAGKTAFTQSVAKNLGIKRKVASPTFVIMKNYELPNNTIRKNFSESSFFEHFIHIDAYRLKNEKELLQLGFEGVISNPKNLVFIEWPENIKKALPKKHYKIEISHTKEGHRKFKIKNF
ncbi:MAG TPA: tRNA (adenosine(37)-N6)-threonylcarbamoyltransferase complex ATPase subunit type 1 TsaE [Candidatus Paceibacterota bacterium]|nr:tRNA (adenosine(37)-N6)-threonylcarbamoyltransferase complex ATPase subunit type 1 TsaE [Candidatus Paceibacterota bacterium]HPT17991.1 tRNA (adenosine(37)-N6)-threonylcarbamoyltransferase complex ATPase subunit type 1 TsaE [Candidatus Paceibacterota bacterium]